MRITRIAPQCLRVTGIALLLCPWLVHLWGMPLQFNQFLLQRLDARYGVMTAQELVDELRSAYTSGVNILHGKPIRTQPDFEDVKGMFRYVFSWVPPYAIVYPTEGFYYFSFSLKGKQVAGNLRVADLDLGTLTMAYFTGPEQETRFLDITTADGLRVVKHSDYLYDVTYGRQTIRFKIPRTSIQRPHDLRRLPEEEWLAQIHDESGLRLWLLYNYRTASFYEVLNEEQGVTDRFEAIGHHLVVGRRTGFVFYQDATYGRKVLVGVYRDTAYRNNYFDGPADQVPYRLTFRDKLHTVYPNTLLGDGVDEHGVYLNTPLWQRIAVAPYQLYTSTQELFERAERCASETGKSALWTCLTREWWNTPEWRQEIADTLAKQGKVLPPVLRVTEPLWMLEPLPFIDGLAVPVSQSAAASSPR